MLESTHNLNDYSGFRTQSVMLAQNNLFSISDFPRLREIFRLAMTGVSGWPGGDIRVTGRGECEGGWICLVH